VAELDACPSEDRVWLAAVESLCCSPDRTDFENWLLQGSNWQTAFSLAVSIHAGWVDVGRRPAAVADVGEPQLIVAHGTLIESFREHPELLSTLPSRLFEAVTADLMSDQGWDIQLTPSTRDGGMDIRAYWNTGNTRIKCLVETKRYRKDRPVGVGAVRQLYGVLHDNGANQAMIVTTSSFTAGARKLASEHPFQLCLCDCEVLHQWIRDYRRGPRRRM
jgi:hypothetical protein